MFFPACTSRPVQRADLRPGYISGSPVRVGVFDRTEILVAYYGSAIHDEWLRGLERERDEAVARGDSASATAIEARGAAAQEVAHDQLAGKAGLWNILPHIEPSFADIAREKGLVLLVEAPLFAEPGVELVDVTAELAARFRAAATGEHR